VNHVAVAKAIMDGASIKDPLASIIIKAVPDLHDVHEVAAELAETQAGNLIKDLNGEQRYMVQRLVKQAIQRGWTDQELQARLKNKIGLHPRYAQAVDNLLNKNLGDGMAPGKAQRLADQYAARLRADRALAIARYEVAKALNDANRILWQEQQEDGDISPYAVRIFKTHPDEARCKVCKRLNGRRISLKATDPAPPLHPNCRCWEELSDQGIVKSRSDISKREPRDADADGWIYEGTPKERPAPPKAPESHRLHGKLQWRRPDGSIMASRTEVGDTFEALFALKVAPSRLAQKVLGRRMKVQVGALASNRRQGAIDVITERFALELKTMNAKAKRRQVSLKPEEVASKEKAAEAMGLQGGIVAQVVDMDTKTVRLWAYLDGFTKVDMKTGRKSGKHEPESQWISIGTYKFTDAEFYAAQDNAGWGARVSKKQDEWGEDIEDGDTVIELVEDTSAPGGLRPILYIEGEDDG
jgi:hypothetical protein